MSDGNACVVTEPGGGEKLQVLKTALNNAVSKVLGGWRTSLLASCFPSLAKDYEEHIEAIRVGIVEAVQNSLFEDFAALIDEDVTKSLEEVSIIIKNSSSLRDTIVWRPPGDPQSHIQAHDAKVLRYEKQHLLDTLKRVKLSSRKAQKAVQGGYNECQKNCMEIEKNLSVIGELLETSGAINEAGINDLCQAVFSRPSDTALKIDSDMEENVL